MSGIHFTVPGPPVPKARARTHTNAHGYTSAYTPEKTVEATAEVAKNAHYKASLPLLVGPVALVVDCYLPVPRSWPAYRHKGAVEGKERPYGGQTGDVDNYLKLVADAINGIGWIDDCQVVEATVRKFYSDRPRTEITVAPTEEDDG